MEFKDTLLKISRSLYPKGRAFKFPFGGVLESLHKGLALSEERLFSDSINILDTILPDNVAFAEVDAVKWERRLGLITEPLTSLADRKLALLRKINHPGTIVARQHFLYLQGQLQGAGFNVFVHENRFPFGGGFITKTPAQILGTIGAAVHSPIVQHGQINQGEIFSEKVVNSIDPAIDAVFEEGDNFRSTFFIGAEILGDFASIPASRVTEFRQLILKTKPVQTIAFLFIDEVISGLTKGLSQGGIKITSTGDIKITS